MRTIIIPESIYDRLCAILTNYEDPESSVENDGKVLYINLVDIVNDIAECPYG